jgi:hypothetical protein
MVDIMIDEKIDRLIRLSDRCFALAREAKEQGNKLTVQRKEARGDKFWQQALRLVMQRDKCRHHEAFRYIVGYKYD